MAAICLVIIVNHQTCGSKPYKQQRFHFNRHESSNAVNYHRYEAYGSSEKNSAPTSTDLDNQRQALPEWTIRRRGEVNGAEPDKRHVDNGKKESFYLAVLNGALERKEGL